METIFSTQLALASVPVLIITHTICLFGSETVNRDDERLGFERPTRPCPLPLLLLKSLFFPGIATRNSDLPVFLKVPLMAAGLLIIYSMVCCLPLCLAEDAIIELEALAPVVWLSVGLFDFLVALPGIRSALSTYRFWLRRIKSLTSRETGYRSLSDTLSCPYARAGIAAFRSTRKPLVSTPVFTERAGLATPLSCTHSPYATPRFDLKFHAAFQQLAAPNYVLGRVGEKSRSEHPPHR